MYANASSTNSCCRVERNQKGVEALKDDIRGTYWKLICTKIYVVVFFQEYIHLIYIILSIFDAEC